MLPKYENAPEKAKKVILKAENALCKPAKVLSWVKTHRVGKEFNGALRSYADDAIIIVKIC